MFWLSSGGSRNRPSHPTTLISLLAMAYASRLETVGDWLRLWRCLWCDWPPKISSATWPTCGRASCAPLFLHSVRGWVLETIRGKPREVPHWPPFCAWWNSRRELKGPADEATDIIWITATDQLDSILYYWTGPLLLCIARWLFPACHIALIDNDCVPLSLFEIADLLKLSQQLPEWRTLLEGDDDSPIQIGMLLVTEPHFEHNAGLVISPASDLYAPDLNAPVDKLSEQFLACLTEFLNTALPRRF